MTVDLTSRYMGFTLRSPLVASPGPMTGNPDMWQRLEDAGAAAIVLPSLFEEEVEGEALAVDALLDSGTDMFGEALSYLPGYDDYNVGPHRFLSLVERAVDQLSIPVIASLNGTTSGGWVRYAKHLVEAGAHALELNIYDVVADPTQSGSDVERRYLDLVEAVRAEVRVPLAVKLGPWFTAPAHFCKALDTAGADALVVFNRFYQPDIDLDTLDVKPQLHLSSSNEVRLRIHWIGILYGNVGCSLAATGGVHTGDDVARLLLAGADATMTTSALLQRGPEHLRQMEADLVAWMEEKEYESVEQLKGSVSQRNVADPQTYQRANYVQVIQSWARSFSP